MALHGSSPTSRATAASAVPPGPRSSTSRSATHPLPDPLRIHLQYHCPAKRQRSRSTSKPTHDARPEGPGPGQVSLGENYFSAAFFCLSDTNRRGGVAGVSLHITQRPLDADRLAQNVCLHHCTTVAAGKLSLLHEGELILVLPLLFTVHRRAHCC